MPAEDQLSDPYGAYYFALEINGIEIAHFMECAGMKTSSTVFEIEEGGVNGYTHKRPGQSKWENIVLKYASSASTELLELSRADLQQICSHHPEVEVKLRLAYDERRMQSG